MEPLSANAGSPAMLNRLVQRARQQGADAATSIPAADIRVEARLARRCRDPRCDMVGLAARTPSANCWRGSTGPSY
jgi:predicted metal-binding protein